MNTVMISGHFDPLTHAHMDYIRQAMNYGGFILCVVSSDKQLLMKKHKVNIPEEQRRTILDSILEGLHVPHRVIVNAMDTEDTSITKALQIWRPNILVRGGDKKPEDMPAGEAKACADNNIKIFHAQFRIDVHGSQMVIEHDNL